MPSSGTWIATTVVGCVTSLWLYKENRSLHAELDAKNAPTKTADVQKQDDDTPAPRPSTPAYRPIQFPTIQSGPNDQTRLDKRAQKQQELSAMFGRQDGETDDQYRARVMPFLSAILAMPRKHVVEMRKLAEQKANVTPDQDQQIEAALQPIYQNIMSYANNAISSGSVSPYERNVPSWLEFVGGLGPILADADSSIGRILSTDQEAAMYDTGFEWGEYLGLEAPWEQLSPPPPPKH
ncbi:MAG TPA: hypothetical protein VGG74_27575 [Kofleriaceae bacterium]|jgi:hypothetical protein